MASQISPRKPAFRKMQRLLTVGSITLAIVGGSGSAGAGSDLTTSYQDYVAPAVSLTKTDGKALSFANLVDGSRPVVMEFFYTSCTTICGTQAATLTLASKGLSPNAIVISITIDPDYDTPPRLRQYGNNFSSGRPWFLLTGKRTDILRILTAFDARPFGDNKMLHRPVMFIKVAKGRQWVRLDGLANANQIIATFRAAQSKPPPASSTFSTLRESFNRVVG